ncbi:SPOR domain-containing protein [Tabrizicola sp. TH137]|uniref:SPOR domain-containing protein n=1 Tax=Tabrizicola sp. TH137 TaxID=2067452 RepID=UPI000C7CB731|nr:SPOR domain-containing protein [Tabrizicola sp. TH137]PLL13314.1 SPOR domain-containing protein [Tabrizicola sp. TH137]
MADVDYDDYDAGNDQGWADPVARSGRMARYVHIAGAVCSVALVIGMAYWGYRLAVRDVNGVPVVRAMEGPMRIAPEDPGGEVADHQGLSVNTVAALGTAAPPPDRLVLAPRPVELSQEDAPGMALAGAMPQADETSVLPVSAAAVAPNPALAPVASAMPEDEANLGPDPDAVAQALAEALAEPVPEQVSATPETTASGQLRPRPRPAVPGQEATIEPVSLAGAASSGAPSAEIDPAAIPEGTRLVQLGAFDTADEARAEWVKLGNQFGPLFLGKALVVQAAESGGRTFFRLRAHGFADETEARGFCTEMLAQNASCIPVEQRG